VVTVEFYRDNQGFTAMELKGHAGYNPGNDIVCAGISALAFALVGTLKNIDGISFTRLQYQEGAAVEIEPFADPEVQAVVDAVFTTVLIGLKQIQKQYPENIQVKEMKL
jgi:uncharacterized protein YsxB (DUF464 family)